MQRPPHYPTAVWGFRCWKLADDGCLYPLHYPQSSWQRTPRRARCGSEQAHQAPAPDCHCGWNAFLTLDEALVEQSRLPSPAKLGIRGTVEEGDDAELIVGAVRGWGAVELHRDGWRAEWAQPAALLGGGASAQRAAERYSAPLLRSERELREWVRDQTLRGAASAAPLAALPKRRPLNRRRPAPVRVQVIDDLLWAAALVMFLVALALTVSGSDDPQTISLSEAVTMSSFIVWAALSLWRIIPSYPQGPLAWLWVVLWTRAHRERLAREGLPL